VGVSGNESALESRCLEAQTMTDHTPDFGRMMDACIAQAHLHTLATERVLSFNPDLSAEHRAETALITLSSALDTLEMTKEYLPADSFHRLRDAEYRLSHLKRGLGLTQSLQHLCGLFGKAP
jgi:hypothetical protein